MKHAIETLVLVSDPEVGRALEQLAEHRMLSGTRTLVVEFAEGPAAAAILRVRATRGGVPLGYAADSESAALEAIEHGADEAAVVHGAACEEILRFLDRLEMRATLRREQEQRSQSSAHAEKLTALGTLVAGVGHEINNPLSVLMLSLHAARRTLVPLLNASWELTRLSESDEPIAPQALRELARSMHRRTSSMDGVSLLDEMMAASQSIADVIRDLRVFARADADEHPGVVDAVEAVEQVLRLTGRDVRRSALIERDYQADTPKLVLPRSRLVQVLTNIVVNAAHAMQEVRRDVHRLRITSRADDEFVALSIADTGPGIPPQALERIFDPFYSTKRDQLGTGLGLSISRSILRSLGGDLIVESVYGDGATFICLLPRASPEAIREAMRHDPPASLGRVLPSTSVLIVDDDERVLRACSRYLADRCRIVIARDGQEAIDLLVSGSQVDIVVTELEMPEVDGRELYLWLRDHRPDLAARTVLITDISGPTRGRPLLGERALPVVPKPIQGPALLEAIERVQVGSCDTSPQPSRAAV